MRRARSTFVAPRQRSTRASLFAPPGKIGVNKNSSTSRERASEGARAATQSRTPNSIGEKYRLGRGERASTISSDILSRVYSMPKVTPLDRSVSASAFAAEKVERKNERAIVERGGRGNEERERERRRE